jgi:hypothetical protein
VTPIVVAPYQAKRGHRVDPQERVTLNPR